MEGALNGALIFFSVPGRNIDIVERARGEDEKDRRRDGEHTPPGTGRDGGGVGVGSSRNEGLLSTVSRYELGGRGWSWARWDVACKLQLGFAKFAPFRRD